jgi:hypothetical protein
MKAWAILAVAIALAACSTERAPELDAEVSANLSAQAVERACSNTCRSFELIYARDELVKLGGFNREMPEETQSAISGLFDEIQFARGEDLDELFDADSLFTGGEGILISVGPVEELAEGVLGIDIGLATAPGVYHGETHLFQWDGSDWIPATPEDTGVTVTSTVS